MEGGREGGGEREREREATKGGRGGVSRCFLVGIRRPAEWTGAVVLRPPEIHHITPTHSATAVSCRIMFLASQEK